MLVEGLQRGNPMWIGWSSCFYYELQLLVVLRLGTQRRLFYLPWHKKKVKLILSFQTAAKPKRGKKILDFTIQKYSSVVFKPAPCLVIAYALCGPLHQNGLLLFWFNTFFLSGCLGESSFKVYRNSKASARCGGMGLGQYVCGCDNGAQNDPQIPM